MKKILLSTLIFISLGMLPLSDFANTNPFLQLVRKATTSTSSDRCHGDSHVGTCRAPGPDNPDFCSCFWEQMKEQCPKYSPNPSLCNNKAWTKAEISAMGIPFLCKHFPTGGSDYCWCSTELAYFHDRC